MGMFSELDIMLQTADDTTEVENNLREYNILPGDEIYYTAMKQYEFYKQQQNNEEAQVWEIVSLQALCLVLL